MPSASPVTLNSPAPASRSSSGVPRTKLSTVRPSHSTGARPPASTAADTTPPVALRPTTSSQSRLSESGAMLTARALESPSIARAAAAPTSARTMCEESVVSTVSGAHRTPLAPAAGTYSTNLATAPTRCATYAAVRRSWPSCDSSWNAAAWLGGAGAEDSESCSQRRTSTPTTSTTTANAARLAMYRRFMRGSDSAARLIGPS
jgi:hypothetical protein